MTAFSRNRRAALVIVALMVALPAVIGAITSKLYWGYFFGRPGPIPDALNAAKVEKFTALDCDLSARFQSTSVSSIEDRLADTSREGGYYNLEQRVLFHLDNRAVDWRSAPPLSTGEIDELCDAVMATGRVHQPAQFLSGYIMQLRSANGRPMWFVAVRGWQISNDHYPYYEFLFDRNPQDGGYGLSTSRKFFYDVAGIEGMEWYLLAIGAGMVIWPVLMLAAFAFFVVGWFKLRRPAKGYCVKCGHDLHAVPHRVCPECGAKIQAQ